MPVTSSTVVLGSAVALGWRCRTRLRRRPPSPSSARSRRIALIAARSPRPRVSACRISLRPAPAPSPSRKRSDVGAGRRRVRLARAGHAQERFAALGAGFLAAAGFARPLAWPPACRAAGALPRAGARRAGRHPAASLASRSASSCTACSRVKVVRCRRLGQAGVELAVLDVGAEAARQQLDRLVVLGMPAQLAQRRRRGAAARLPLGGSLSRAIARFMPMVSTSSPGSSRTYFLSSCTKGP